MELPDELKFPVTNYVRILYILIPMCEIRMASGFTEFTVNVYRQRIIIISTDELE